MHRTLITLFLAAALGVPVSGASRTAAPRAEASRPGPADARAEVQRFVKSYIDAWNRGDAPAMMKMISRSPGASAINEGTLMNGWETIRDAAGDWVAAEGSFTIELGRLEVRLLGPSHALAVAPFVLTVLEDDGPVPIQGGLTLVLEKDRDGWRILHEHRSAQLPEDEADDEDEEDEGD
jgi:ketosteroid isomerase-like protein